MRPTNLQGGGVVGWGGGGGGGGGEGANSSKSRKSLGVMHCAPFEILVYL